MLRHATAGAKTAAAALFFFARKEVLLLFAAATLHGVNSIVPPLFGTIALISPITDYRMPKDDLSAVDEGDEASGVEEAPGEAGDSNKKDSSGSETEDEEESAKNEASSVSDDPHSDDDPQPSIWSRV